jgi:hypothetical protein
MSNKKQLEKMLRLSNIQKKPLNESSSISAIEFIKSVADGNTYAIVRENRTYYIKSTETKDTLLESDFDYLGGLGNRTKNSFRGYDDAVTRLNLMFNDINRVQGINEDIDMVNFSHVLNENGEYVKAKPLQEKKFVLKQPKPKVKAPEPDMDFGGSEGGDDFDFGGGEEGGDDEFNFDDEGGDDFGGEGGDDFNFDDEGEGSEGGDDFNFDDEGGEPEMEFDSSEGGDGIKDIQKTTGKLGQQLRDTEDLSSDMQKWVAKSVVSALNLNTMDDSDKDDIINALESGGDEEQSEQEVDFMDDDLEYGEVEYAGGRTMDRGGEPELDAGEEILLDDGEDEGPGGYLGWEEDYEDSNELEMRDIDMGIQDKGYLNLDPASMGGIDDVALQSDHIDYMDDDRPRRPKRPLIRREKNPEDGEVKSPRQPWQPRVRPQVKREDNPSYMGDEEIELDGPIAYMTDDDMEPCREGVDCGEGMEEGMSTWNDADNEGGMGWETNEAVSYMDDEYTEEEIDRLFDNTGISDDNYTMNEPAPTKPTTKPDTDTPAPTRPSKNPFTPPERIRPGEEPRPKAEVDYMAAEPRPSQDPNESPTIAPTKPDTDRPSRPSKNPFTPPERIRPGEEPRPKAGKDVDYMGDSDVEFS